MTQQDIRPPSPAPAPVTLVSVEPERGRPLISYVLPVYNERDGITAFHTELTTALDSRPELDFELVYVNDGSTDGSLELLKGLAERTDGSGSSTSRATSGTSSPSPPGSTSPGATR